MTNASLFIAPQWIGDAVMTEPLLRLLHARGQSVTVAAVPWVAPVYQAMPHVAAVQVLPLLRGQLQWSLRREWAAQWRGRFERAYVAPNSFKSALLPWLAGVPQRLGYWGEWRLGLLTHRLPNPPRRARTSMVAHYLALADAVGGAAPDHAHRDVADWARAVAGADSFAQQQSGVVRGALRAPERVDPQPHLVRTAAQRQATLQALGLAEKTYVVLVPGAEYGPAKRWPSTHFAELAQQLALPALLLGSAKEQGLCADIANAVNAHKPGQAINLAGRTDLLQAMDVMAAARAVVSNDSGLMHVAAAFGVPQVALFGSSSPLHTPPLSPHATVLWLKNQTSYQPALDCAPCFERSCPLGHTRCLNDIAPAQVLAALAV